MKLVTLIILLLAIGGGIYIMATYIKPNFETSKTNIDILTRKAQDIYTERAIQGVDFSKGPCLSENLALGWVADIAHNPREAIDDFPANQCQSFIEGKTHHFIELDPSGKFIRAF